MSVDAITLADITSADWSLKLNAMGQVVQGIDDIDQCIGIILTTPKGSDPLRPTFGADLWQYIDFPIAAAIPAIVLEVSEAIMIWEPRVKLLAVTASIAPKDNSANVNAHLQVSITWQLQLASGTPSPQTTLLTIPG